MTTVHGALRRDEAGRETVPFAGRIRRTDGRGFAIVEFDEPIHGNLFGFFNEFTPNYSAQLHPVGEGAVVTGAVAPNDQTVMPIARLDPADPSAHSEE